ncbi:hypothetical protein CVT24_008550 [Panaeolus cyanescens]|uniref:Signal recognition particle subunit SRP72 n=1 Tax=Panaeolus cyanescens TaxID=181874 RepID=A0A409VB57_9AGAR|nr:hypothetical protein CVT24_008550 [Panaeolus cyanescens]
MTPKTVQGAKKPAQVKDSRWKGQKSAPKKPPTTEEKLKRLFTSLCAQIDSGHFANAVKTCDKILRLNPSDPDAQQTKLYLLLQTEQYDAALTLIDHDDKKDELSYEKAYSLYRLQRESDAKELLNTIKTQKGDDDRGVVHLEAQLNYREGAYEVAFDLYNQLLDTAEPDSEEHSDILTNLQASQKHLDFINTGFLRALDNLPSSTRSTLETAPPPTQPSATALISSASAIASASTSAQNNQVAPKKVRKSRLPAGVIPGVTPLPDPERWLKKSERSTFLHGRKRRGGGGATQGSTMETPASHHATSGGQSKGTSGKGKKKK